MSEDELIRSVMMLDYSQLVMNNVGNIKEIERLNNIISELEKWLIKQQIEEGEFCDFLLENKRIKVEDVLDKLQELKGSDKE